MVGMSLPRASMPSTRISAPASMPGTRRRPSHTMRSRAGLFRPGPGPGRPVPVSETMALNSAVRSAGTKVTDSMCPWHSTRPLSGSWSSGVSPPDAWAGPPLAVSADLGDFGTTFGFLQSGTGGRRGSGGILWQPQLKEIARRHGTVTPDHHHLPEQGFERFGGGALQSCGAAEDTAKEPARTVDADEPGDAVALAAVRKPGRQLGYQFRAKRAFHL